MGKLTVKQAAIELGYHPNHLRRLLRQGVVKGEKLAGVLWQIEPEEVERVRQAQIEGRLFYANQREKEM